RGCKTKAGETMQRQKFDMRTWSGFAALLAATSLFGADAMAAKMAVDPASTVAPTPLAVAERGPTPAARVTPANPEFCKVLGQIAPLDPNAPPIKFQVNLPVEWN